MKHKLAILILIILQVMQIYAKQNNNTWINWALNQTCSPKEIIKPKSRQELIDFLKKAKKEKAHVYATGSRHSSSDIVCNSDYLIDISNLNKVLSIDKKNKIIKVQAGIKVCDLNKALAEENLALPNQSSIDSQTIAGATATATHGTGHTGTLSSFIKDIELVTANGDIHRLSKYNPDYLAAGRVSIGSLGIITALTLQCEPLFELEKKKYSMNLKSIIKLYKKFHDENDFFLFDWDPYTDTVSVNLENKVYTKDMKARKVQIACFHDTTDDLKMRSLAEEIAIPFHKLPNALLKLKQFFKKYENLGIKIYGGVVCRFVQADKNCLLSPSFDRDSVFISINMLSSNNNYKTLFKEYEDLLVNEFNGRPHWGKVNFLDYDRAYKLYGENLTKFIKIKNELDPVGMFSNSFTKRVFGKIFHGFDTISSKSLTTNG